MKSFSSLTSLFSIIVVASGQTTPTPTCTCAASATAVAPPPPTATCGFVGAASLSGVFPLNGFTPIPVPDTASCARACLVYSDNLCKSFLTLPPPSNEPDATGLECSLFAYTDAQLELVPVLNPYGQVATFYDVGCFAFDCASGTTGC